MWCTNCGKQNSDNAAFCKECGKILQNVNTNTAVTYCRICGEPNESGAGFCGNCGHRIENGQAHLNIDSQHRQNIQSSLRTRSTNYTNNERANKKTLIVSIICAAALILVGIVAWILIGSKNDENSKIVLPKSNQKAEQTAAPTVVPTIEPTPTAHSANNIVTPTAEPLRPDLYNPALIYKRMDDISNTSLTDNDTFYMLKAFIEDFDARCAKYMNDIDNSIFAYLRGNTVAYSQQTEYKQKHPNLVQHYQNIDVINARQGNGYYYVWVTETIESFENGKSKTSVEHWVYKIGKDGDGLYINDYTYDPAYNN